MSTTRELYVDGTSEGFPTPKVTSPQRRAAYTTPRADIFGLVPHRALRILDVGCSNGALGASLKRANVARRVVGVEVASDLADEATNVLDDVVRTDANRFDWSALKTRERPFDCVIFADVLEHLIDPERHLRAAHELLTDGGCVIMSLPNIRHVSALYAIALKGAFPRNDRGLFDRTHLRWFTHTDALAMIRDTGFEVEAIDHALRWGDSGGGRANRLLNKLPAPVKHFLIFREFLTYQFCMRLVRAR